MRFRGSVSLLFAVALGAAGSGCTVAPTRPAPPPPLREIEREDRGEIVTVSDTKIDLRNPANQGLTTHTPRVPVGPVGIRVPIRIGGEARYEVPAEEITVRLTTGRMVFVVQQRSDPPLAPGERVRVLQETASAVTGQSRMRVERE